MFKGTRWQGRGWRGGLYAKLAKIKETENYDKYHLIEYIIGRLY